MHTSQLVSQAHPKLNTKIRQGQITDHFHEHKCKTSKQNISKLNISYVKKNNASVTQCALFGGMQK